ITRPICSRSSSTFLRKDSTCSLPSFMKRDLSEGRLTRVSVARSNELEITPYVELVARRDVVASERFFGHGFVVRIHLTVVDAGEAPRCGAVHDFACRGALAR